MISSDLYFQIPNNIELALVGNYTIPITNTHNYDFVAKVEDTDMLGDDKWASIIVSHTNTSLTINIPDHEIKGYITVSIKSTTTDDENSLTLIFHPADRYINVIDENIVVGNSWGSVIVNIDTSETPEFVRNKIQYDKLYRPTFSKSGSNYYSTVIFNNGGSGFEGSFASCAYRNLSAKDEQGLPTTKVYCQYSNSDTFSTIDKEVEFVGPEYLFGNFFYLNGSSYDWMRLRVVGNPANIFFGFNWDIKDIFLYDVESKTPGQIRFAVAPNSWNVEHTQTFRIFSPYDNITYAEYEIKQQPNTSSVFMNIPNNIEVPCWEDIFDTQQTITYRYGLECPSYCHFGLIRTNIQNPANPAILNIISLNNILSIARSRQSSKELAMANEKEQIVNIKCTFINDDWTSIMPASEQIKYLYGEVTFTIRAGKKIYSSDNVIEISSNGKVPASISLDTHSEVYEASLYNSPEWINTDDITFDNTTSTLYINRAEPNLTGSPRSATVELRAWNEEHTEFLNRLSFELVQAAEEIVSDTINPLWKDYVIVFDEPSIDNEISIYDTPADPNGNITGNQIFRASVFDRILLNDIIDKYFDIKEFFNPFNSTLTEFKTRHSFAVTNVKWIPNIPFVWDYSYDERTYIDHVSLTDVCQVIDYFDNRQYITQTVNHIMPSIYRQDNALLVNGSRRNYTLDNDSNYNFTLNSQDGINSIQVIWKNLSGAQQYGKLYKSKCTNAKYVLYYLNPYGGWNWMLFEGKTLVSDNTKYEGITTTNNNKYNYGVEVTTSYDLTTKYLTDEQSHKLRYLYSSPYVFIQNLEENGTPIEVVLDTKSYSIKTFNNQGRKFFTHNIKVTENKSKNMYI